MAKTFRKLVVKPGVYHPSRADGKPRPEYVPASRIKKWVDNFRAMKADGIRVPIPWGHQRQANPVREDSISQSQFHNSRYNASFVEDLEMDADGALWATGKVPPGMDVDSDGDLIDPANHTRIGEVSLAACSWKDGSGKTWEDSIRHIALVTMPVAHGTPGFQPMEMATDQPEGEVWFSLSSYQGAEFAMVKPGFTTTSDDPKEDATGAGEEKRPTIDFKPKDSATNQPDLVTDLIQRLERAGIHLPEDTTSENFLQHLKVALHAVEKREGGDQPKGDDMIDKTKPDQQTGNPAAPLKEEPMPGMFMSLSLADLQKHPAVAALVNEKKTSTETSRKNRIESLKKRGLKVEVADRLLAQVGTVEFSLDSDGKLSEQEIDRMIAFAEEILPNEGESWADGAILALEQAEVQIPPEGTKNGKADELAERYTTRGPAHKVGAA